jgi:hypothetical protein
MLLRDVPFNPNAHSTDHFDLPLALGHEFLGLARKLEPVLGREVGTEERRVAGPLGVQEHVIPESVEFDASSLRARDPDPVRLIRRVPRDLFLAGTETRSNASAPSADSESTGAVTSAPTAMPFNVRVVAEAAPQVNSSPVVSRDASRICSPRVMDWKRSQYSGDDVMSAITPVGRWRRPATLSTGLVSTCPSAWASSTKASSAPSRGRLMTSASS